jgi:hypothetical protein
MRGRQAISAVSQQVGALSSPLLMRAKDNPRFQKDLQVMLDFDSTVFPLLDAMQTHHLATDKLTYQEMHSWEALVPASGGPENMQRIFDEVMVFEKMKAHRPFRGAKEVLRHLHRHGVQIHIVSDRRPDLSSDIADYLDQYQLHYDSLLCQKGIDKLNWCKEHQVRIVVDDYPNFLARAHQAGLKTHGLAFPFNREVLAQRDVDAAETWTQLGQHLFNDLEQLIQERERAALES